MSHCWILMSRKRHQCAESRLMEEGGDVIGLDGLHVRVLGGEGRRHVELNFLYGMHCFSNVNLHRSIVTSP
jgi:hypothetical protein